jgi:hypothetical protein
LNLSLAVIVRQLKGVVRQWQFTTFESTLPNLNGPRALDKADHQF